jgi:hypothetical protein
MMPAFFSGLEALQSGVSQVLWLAASGREELSLRAQIAVLGGLGRFLSPSEGYGRRLQETAARFRGDLQRSEQALARSHAERLFSDAVFNKILFSSGFGRVEESLLGREDVFRKIDAEGMGGYLEFLVAVLNQHWAPLLLWETLRGRYSEDPAVQDEEHRPSAVLIAGLLNTIDSDRRIAFRFQVRWKKFSPRYPLETVRDRTREVLSRLL